MYNNGAISTLNVKLSTAHAPITVYQMDEVLCNYNTERMTIGLGLELKPGP